MRMKWLDEYQCWVFDDGRVAIPSKNGLRYRKHIRSGNGYINVTTHGRKMVGLHRLLALAFIPNPDPSTKTDVDHIDRNPLNNSLSNLRWVTPKENSANCDRADRSLEKYGIKPSIDKKEYLRRYYLKNKDRICANVKKYRESHADKLRVYEQSRKDIKNEQRRARNRMKKEASHVEAQTRYL